ncbi:MAG: hypothetical protein ASARMPREDX12_008790 [Alectoria sarmentosa]|nr:MAG: hypothetical protein ASARMPREDX12_008790 [Alectoria sarmentosa]
MSRRPAMSDFNEEPIHRHGYHDRPPNTHANGTRDFDDETTHQRHKSHGRPNGADERRLNDPYEEAPYHRQGSHTTPQHALGGTRGFVDGVTDHHHGMEDFVDSLEGMTMGSRHHSKHVKLEDSQDKAHYMDGFMEDKEARHAKYSHEDDHRKDQRHGEHRQGGQQHKQHEYQERRHGEHQHKENQQKEHEYQERRHGEHQPKENQHQEHRHGEHQHKEHQPKELQLKEHQPKEHKHKEHQSKEHRHGGHQPKEHQPKEHKHKEHQPKELQFKEHQPKEHQPKEHQPKEHKHKEHQSKEHRHGEHQPKEHQPKEHQPKEHKHKEHQPKEKQPKEHKPKEHQLKEQKEYKPKEHKPKEHQHKEHRHEEDGFKKFNKKLYESALQPFREKEGSRYPCKQSEIDFHQKGVFAKANNGPFVTAMQATEEIMRWNDEKRAPPRDELAIIRDLTIAVHDAEKNLHFGPDLVIKTFADLDRIFFGGRLRGHVAVSWVSNLSSGTRGAYGVTEFHKPGSCHIKLSAEAILLQKWTKVGKNPVATSFGTTLHEMCHAYEFVRCPHEALRGGAHGKHFSTKIGVIHDRAIRILGTWAVEDWEPYKQQLFLPKEGEKGRKESISGGEYDGGKKYDGSQRKYTGTRKEGDSWGTRKGTDCVVM